ncbi:hypothetical protein [Streptomyces sp. NPDC012888]|uniref:hypothetical protein n=1 Tax=Streptomyces sp. NPDC012888 TaxID=3364855 RepID=UPI00369932E4
MNTHCLRCTRALWHDEPAICRHCETLTSRQLRELPALFQHADQTAALFKTRTLDAGGSGQPAHGSPVRLAVLDLTANGGTVARLQAIEDAWRQALAWDMGADRRRTDIAGVATFLTNNLRWACENYGEIADDLATIARLHSQLSGILTGERPARTFAAYCDQDGCGGQMAITLWTRTATCSECGTRYEGTELKHLRTEFDEPASGGRTAA